MKKGKPEKRQVAEAEFWDSINGFSMFCTATAPGVDAYLELVESGEIAFRSGLAASLGIMLADASVVEKHAGRKTLAMQAEIRS